jgi:Fe-S oxidoreductase
VNNVITACPGCHDVFLRYGTGLRAVSVYEVVAEYGSGFPHIGLEFTVHDPCALRFNDEVSGAVRKLLSDAGVTVVEMKHSRRTTFCCSEGGAVARADPELSDVWREKVFSEAEGMRVLTSCGGCQHRLSRRMAAIHLLDLLYNPAARAGDGRASRPPMTYLNRFLFRIRTGRMMRDEPRKPAPQ